MDESTKIVRQDKITEEIKRINGILAKMEAKTKTAVKSLVENAAFMAVTLQELADTINKNGVTEKYQNGANQHGLKKSSEVEVYNTMIKNYSSVMKQLTDLLPKAEPGKTPTENDGFNEFLAERDGR